MIAASITESDPNQKWFSSGNAPNVDKVCGRLEFPYPLGEAAMCCVVFRCFATTLFACLVATPVTAEEANSPALTYSPWSKVCLNETCAISRLGVSNADCGTDVVVKFIERNGETKRTLRVTMPTRVSLERGIRITIDQSGPVERPYVGCFANGCAADYDAGAELVDQLKQGRMLVLDAVDKNNTPITRTIPLTDFAGAYDGPERMIAILPCLRHPRSSERQ